jgi:hypothetical protein
MEKTTPTRRSALQCRSLVGRTDIKEKAKLLPVDPIKAGIRREDEKEDKVNFEIGTAMPLFGRNEKNLGADDRGDGGRSRCRLEDRQHNISFCKCPRASQASYQFHSRLESPAPGATQRTSNADPFPTVRTFKEQNSPQIL